MIASETAMMFTGKERDGETGLDYSIARYYSGAQGRFTSPDPDNLGSIKGDPQSWNMYGYVRNNPLKFTDPLGLNYTVCDAQGSNCADLTDKQYEQYRKSSSNIYSTAGGTLYSINQDGSDTKVGSATYYNERDQQAAAMIGFGSQAVINEFAKQAALNVGFNLGGRALASGLGYGMRLYRAARAGDEAIAATPVGRLGTNFSAVGNNGEQLIEGRLYSGHALDRMQERGAVPSIIEDIISNGTRSPGRYPGTTEIKGANGTVIVGGKLLGIVGAEKVITVIPK